MSVKLWFRRCDHCKHRRTEDTCAAFLEGIPTQFIGFDSNADHRRPYDGDNGIQFEPKDEEARQVAARLPRPVDPEKVHALGSRIAKVRHTINAIVGATGQKLPSRIIYLMSWAEKVEDLPANFQAFLREAERRQGIRQYDAGLT